MMDKCDVRFGFRRKKREKHTEKSTEAENNNISAAKSFDNDSGRDV